MPKKTLREKKIKIVNVIASTRIKGSIDIEALVYNLPNTQYEPETFSGLIYRKAKPKITIIMFFSGKISSHGAKSENEARQAIIRVLREIEDLNCIIGSNEMEEIKIENVVGVGDVDRTLDLKSSYLHIPNAKYKPDQFPGLMYRPFNDSVVCLIFSSGKIVIVGGKSGKQVINAFQDIIGLLDVI